MPQTILALIPARGGSKGIPRKNVRLLAGKPLVAHSIVQARQTPGVTRVVVSTDDEEIAALSQQWGAEVVRRPVEISGDTASSESALAHALDTLRDREGWEPDRVVFLQATSPCRRPGEIAAALETLEREQADSLLSVGPVHGFVWRVEKDGRARSFSYDHLKRPRRQDAPEDLIENGSIYVFKPWVLRQHNNRLGGKVALHRMSALDSFQIDEPGDFDLLEALMARRLAPAAPRAAELARIALVVLDFDGVLTDNRVLVMEDGREGVACDRGDGLGIARLRQAGVEVAVLSKERNPVVAARCRKLGIECAQGCDEKLPALQALCAQRGLGPEQTAYAGNDVNDLECLRWAGLPVAVADALPEVLAAARWTTPRPGGRGAVRDLCDLLLQARAAGPAADAR